MLVVTRKPGERVKIADNIWVVVVRVQEGKVQLGFDCPREIKIMREELIERQECRDRR